MTKYDETLKRTIVKAYEIFPPFFWSYLLYEKCTVLLCLVSLLGFTFSRFLKPLPQRFHYCTLNF